MARGRGRARDREQIVQGQGSSSSSRVLQRYVLQLRRWLLPGLFVLSCWLLLVRPDKARAFLPLPQSSWLLGIPSVQHKSAVLPKSRSAVFQLGFIAGKLNSQQADQSTLKSAASLLELSESEVTVELISNLRQAFHDADHGSIGARVRGLFSFVNFIWCISIVGVSVSATPVVLIFARPVVNLVRVYAQPFLAALLHWAKVLQPVFQAVSFWLCFYIIAAAARYPDSYRHFIALSGCILVLPVYFWATALHDAAAHSELEMVFDNTFMCLVLTPVAVMYGSSLIGFFSSAALFGALGLSAIPTGLAWHVGFSSLSDLHRVAVTSALILSALVGAQAVTADSIVLQPFQTGLSVFGSIGLFLAGLIITSGYHASSRRYFQIANVGFLLVLLLSVLVGSLFGLAAVQNTAITFFILWAMEKVVELSIGRCTWVAVFCLSIMSWQLALWLHSHPEFVQSLFQW